MEAWCYRQYICDKTGLAADEAGIGVNIRDKEKIYEAGYENKRVSST